MKTNPKGTLYIISSVAGGGKSTLIYMLLEKHPSVKFSISTTSRQPRGTEVEGGNYNYVSKEEFERLIQKDYFLEWALVHDNYYGTPKNFIVDGIENGNTIILDIDVQGFKTVKEKLPNLKSIFILPPDETTWINRLTNRGTDSKESIEKRISNGRKELLFADEYDYKIVNQDLDKAYLELENIVVGHNS